MMNQIKTARVQLLRFMFLLPLVAILLMAFRKEAMEQKVKANFMGASPAGYATL